MVTVGRLRALKASLVMKATGSEVLVRRLGSWRSLASELWRRGPCSQFPRIETLTISGKLTMMAQRVGRASGAGARTGVGRPQ